MEYATKTETPSPTKHKATSKVANSFNSFHEPGNAELPIRHSTSIRRDSKSLDANHTPITKADKKISQLDDPALSKYLKYLSPSPENLTAFAQIATGAFSDRVWKAIRILNLKTVDKPNGTQVSSKGENKQETKPNAAQSGSSSQRLKGDGGSSGQSSFNNPLTGEIYTSDNSGWPPLAVLGYRGGPGGMNPDQQFHHHENERVSSSLFPTFMRPGNTSSAPEERSIKPAFSNDISAQSPKPVAPPQNLSSPKAQISKAGVPKSSSFDSEKLEAGLKGVVEGFLTGILIEGGLGAIIGVGMKGLASTLGYVGFALLAGEILSKWDKIGEAMIRIFEGTATKEEYEKFGEVIGGILSSFISKPVGKIGRNVGGKIKEGAQAASQLVKEAAGAVEQTIKEGMQKLLENMLGEYAYALPEGVRIEDTGISLSVGDSGTGGRGGRLPKPPKSASPEVPKPPAERPAASETTAKEYFKRAVEALPKLPKEASPKVPKPPVERPASKGSVYQGILERLGTEIGKVLSKKNSAEMKAIANRVGKLNLRPQESATVIETAIKTAKMELFTTEYEGKIVISRVQEGRHAVFVVEENGAVSYGRMASIRNKPDPGGATLPLWFVEKLE